ncbi:MAG: putative transcriptional regulator [Myxococcaceae bacterium]|nr:putative transcriptional regulator [Myxococcaceae bacterium]
MIMSAKEVGPAPLSPRGEQSRQWILRAASELLAETGELEVASVALRAKVSVGLPYRYFGSKSGLLSVLVDDFHTRLAEAVVYRDFPGATWQEREQQRVSEWVRFLFSESLAPVMLVGLGGDATVAASWQRRLSLAVDRGARNIARGQRDGDLPKAADPTILAAAVLGGVQAAVAVALASSPRPAQAKVARSLWSFVRGAVEYQAPRASGPRHV